MKSVFSRLSISLVFILFSLSSYSQSWYEVGYGLPLPNAEVNTQGFGSSCAIDGNYAVVSTRAKDFTTSTNGRVFILEKDNGNWAVVAELFTSDSILDRGFGYSVGISGNNVVVGAALDDSYATNTGVSFIYTKPIAGWSNITETAKIHASVNASNQFFGWSVDIHDSCVIVGAQNSKAYIFKQPATGWVDTTETAVLTSTSTSINGFGHSVSINEDLALVGAPNQNTSISGSGVVYLYQMPVGGWMDTIQSATLMASTQYYQANLGMDIDVYQGQVIAGAPGSTSLSGAAYVFVEPLGGWSGVVNDTAKLIPANSQANDKFGSAVGISDSSIIVGATNIDFNAGAVYLFSKPNIGWVDTTESGIINMCHKKSGDNFGCSVGIDFDEIIVGSFLDDFNSDFNVGSVLFYEDSSLIWSDTCLSEKIFAGFTFFHDAHKFGYSIDMDSSYCVVGAVNSKGENGSAVVYFYDGVSWVPKAQLIARDYVGTSTGQYFGKSVSIDGDIIVVGATGNINLSGLAYVFKKPPGGWDGILNEIAILSGSDCGQGDAFGSSVSISNDQILVGAPWAPGATGLSGAAYLFIEPVGGWVDTTESYKFYGIGSGNNDQFGRSVDISGDDIVVGCWGYNPTSSSNGCAFVMTKPSTGWVSGGMSIKLYDSIVLPTESFGASVSISGNTIVVGAVASNNSSPAFPNYGSAYVFEKPTSGWATSSQTARLTLSSPIHNSNFATSVSIHNDIIAVGANNHNGVGRAYLYEKPVSGWVNSTELVELTGSNTLSNDYFGISVSVWGEFLAVGASQKDEPGLPLNCGAAYLFKRCPITYDTFSFIECSNFISPSGKVWNVSGTYLDTISNSCGADSILTINLTIKSPSYSYDTLFACDSLTWINGVTYYSSSNSATDTFVNSVGCDSIVTLILTIQSVSVTDVILACDSLTWINGITYYATTNTPTDTLVNIFGCDSIVTLDLTIIDKYVTDTIVACDSLTWVNGITYYTSNNTAIDTLVNSLGCDSIVSLNLIINDSVSTVYTQFACDSLTWINGITYYSSTNTEHIVFSNSQGCDSIIYLNLVVNYSDQTTQVINTCASYLWPLDSVLYTSSGNYYDTLTNTQGCDSIVTLELYINDNTGYQQVMVCDSFLWSNGLAYYVSDSLIIDTFTNVFGCDSISTLSLTIIPKDTAFINITQCDSFYWSTSGTVYYSNGIYVVTLTNSFGCDSVVILDLTINQADSTFEFVTTCDSFYWSLTNNTLDSSGIYISAQTNSFGCDSLIFLDLMINYTEVDTQLISICNDYTWPVNGQTYFLSGQYGDTFTNSLGCDSILILDLTIHNESFDTLEITACDSFHWGLNNVTYYLSGFYSDTTTNLFGCDSILILNLSLNQSISVQEQVETCFSYVWSVNGMELVASGIYIDTLVSVSGCDSIVELDLTINDVSSLDLTVFGDTIVALNDSADQYQWLKCGTNDSVIYGATSYQFIAVENGNYAVIITDNGCADTSNCVTISTVGVNQIVNDFGVKCFPNPTRGQLNVQFASLQSKFELKLFSVTGQLVYHTNYFEANSAVVKLEEASGIYILEVINSENRSMLFRVVKQ